MPIIHRPAQARGHANHGWHDSFHTFSFADYYDPKYMGFGPLRVINEDRVAPGAGFETHGHRDMEIISYVVDGALEHKDSVGAGSIIRAGDAQVMSAGTGILHSEFNHSNVEIVHFLQIWIMPNQRGLTPRYDQKTFTDEEKRSRLQLITSRHGREGSLLIHQDADVFASLLKEGENVTHELKPHRRAWVQVIRGSATVNNIAAGKGDGIAIWDEKSLSIVSSGDTEFLVFDLP
jgi:hypothetical protein